MDKKQQLTDEQIEDFVEYVHACIRHGNIMPSLFLRYLNAKQRRLLAQDQEEFYLRRLTNGN